MHTKFRWMSRFWFGQESVSIHHSCWRMPVDTLTLFDCNKPLSQSSFSFILLLLLTSVVFEVFFLIDSILHFLSHICPSCCSNMAEDNNDFIREVFSSLHAFPQLLSKSFKERFWSNIVFSRSRRDTPSKMKSCSGLFLLWAGSWCVSIGPAGFLFVCRPGWGWKINIIGLCRWGPYKCGFSGGCFGFGVFYVCECALTFAL